MMRCLTIVMHKYDSNMFPVLNVYDLCLRVSLWCFTWKNMLLFRTGQPVAVTHSRGRGPASKSAGSDATESASAAFNSMAEIASCSYEARQVETYFFSNFTVLYFC